MDPELVTKMVGLLTTLASKPTLRGPELQVYLRGLSFCENQLELWNLALEQGIDEINRDPSGINGEDLDTKIHPPNSFDPSL